MIELDERMQRLAESIELPPTTPEDDLARGRARRRHRNLGALGAGLTTAVVIGTCVVLLSAGSGNRGAGPDIAGQPSATAGSEDDAARSRAAAEAALRDEHARAAAQAQLEAEQHHLMGVADSRITQLLDDYRDILREDLDPGGTRIQTDPITNRQGADQTLGTKLDWNHGGLLQVAVGRTLDEVQFFCDGACTHRSVPGATDALVLRSGTAISVAVFQEDGDVVALTADTSFGNNGTSTQSLGLSVDELLAAAADPRLQAPVAGSGSSPSPPGP
ncbi:hypothetical protein [Nocardioides pocheonensis]|uniref:Uncharacterized protein n=1 Tax=Nocardioides pocheonensis TaxID=661485 RepID=A0A3N0GNW7_9ACTN|nr:hypothetical protein [Nocardioides pocheonensis]RNM13848.1 hypothetical protein EFL26_12860 [Nocardioides pocheonensis]